MRIVLEMYDETYSVATDYDDVSADKLKEMFSRLMVQAGYSPSVIDDSIEDGHWEWVTSGEDSK